jgi:ribokinase
LVEVVGVGALNWDRILLVDRFAKPGEEIVIKSVWEEAGGSAANTIATLGRLGVETGFMGKIGLDEKGARIISSFEKDSVFTDNIVREEGRTGTVFSFVDEMGERSMYIDSGVNDSLLLEDLNIEYLRSSECIHLSSFAGSTSIKTLKKISGLKGTAMLSFAPGFLCSRGIDFLQPMLKNCSILFINETEAEALTGHPFSKAPEILIDAGVEKVVVTLGKRGSLVVGQAGPEEVAGFKSRVVDTTGAGDAFSAGFLYGMLKRFDDRASAKIGNFIASKCIEHMGARKGLPDKITLKSSLSMLL